MKIKLKNKFNEMKPREGTKNVGESITDQSQAEECDVYACLKKYGVTTLVNKTLAQEYLYFDNTHRNMSLDEAIRMRKEMNEYFSQLPARVRKTFGDSPDIFIEKYKNGEFQDFLSTGVLNEELVAKLKGEEYINNTTKILGPQGERRIKNVQMEKDLSSTQGISTDSNQGDTGTLE